MVKPGYRECPYCFEEIKEKARICRFCRAVLTSEGLQPVFADAEGAPPPSQPVASDEDTVVSLVEQEFRSKGVQLTQDNWNNIKRILASARDEYRQATVLFIDLSGYTRMSTEVAAEEMKRHLEAFYGFCVHSISLHNGFVVKFIGDGVLAVFGAPVAYDRDAESAVRAAFEIREEVEFFPPVGKTRMSISAGLDTGEILSTVVRSHHKDASFDVFGNAVNLACRIQSIAKEGEILISEETYQLVKPVFHLKKKRARRLKGISDPVVAYAVEGIKNGPIVRRDFNVPFLGRTREIQRIRDFITSSSRQSRILSIAGQPGIGKSRLLHQVLEYLSPTNCFLIDCHPETSKSPYYVLAEFVRICLGLQDRPESDLSRLLRMFSLRYPQFTSDDMLYFRHLLGDAAAIESLKELPPELFQRNLSSCLRRLMALVSGEQGLILCVDDLQWVDHGSMQMLSELFEKAPCRGCKLITLQRTRFEPSWQQPDAIPRITLHDLTEPDRRMLLQHFLGRQELVPEVAEAVLKRANGNPLYLEHIARSLLEQLETSKEGSSKKQSKVLAGVLPGSLKEIIQSRIDLLQDQTRRVLQCAAVLGQRFTFDLIHLFEFIRDNLLDKLYSLEGMEFLRSHRTREELEFIFNHPLTQEVAYQSLLRKRREELHLLVARRLEDTFKDRLHGIYDLLAFHYSRTQNHDKAVYYLHKAGDRARQVYANRDALELYDEALSKLEGVTPTPERQVQIARLLIDKGRLCRLLGEMDESYESFEACQSIAARLGNNGLPGRCLHELGLNRMQQGNYKQAREDLQLSLESARQNGNGATAASTLNALGVLALSTSELTEAEEAFSEVMLSLDEEVSPCVKGDAANNLGLIFWRKGSYKQALDMLKSALEFRRQAHDRFGMAATLMNIGIVEEQLGNYTKARESHGNALKLMEQLEYAQGLAAVYANLGNLQLKLGEYHDAQKHNMKSLLHSQEIGDKRSEAIALENLGLGYAALGSAKEAEEHLKKALALGEELDDTERQLSSKLSLFELGVNGYDLTRENEEFEKLGKQVEQQQFAELIPRLHRLQGKWYCNRRQLLEAEKAFEAAVECAEKIDNAYEARQSLVKFIEYLRENKPQEAEKYELRLGKIGKEQ